MLPPRPPHHEWILPRGAGSIGPRSYRNRRGRRKLTKTLYITYWVGNVKHREPAHTDDYDVAFALLVQRLNAIGRGLPAGLRAQKLTFEDLARFIRRSYEEKKNRSGSRLEQHLKHLERFFGAKAPALSITASRVVDFKLARRKQGAAEATINRELAALKRAFRVGAKLGELLLEHVPSIELTPEDNARQGVITPVQMAEFLGFFKPQLARVLEVSYITGWRAFSEVLTRQWSHVHWEEGVLVLEQGEGKARKERKFPLFPRLRALLEAQRRWTEEEERKHGISIPWVFHHWRGQPIRHYRRSWIAACRQLAKARPEWRPQEWIRHRMRYSAVENLLAAGFAEADICKMVGMSRATLHRYHHLHEANLARAGARLNEMFPVQGFAPQRLLKFPPADEKGA